MKKKNLAMLLALLAIAHLLSCSKSKPVEPKDDDDDDTAGTVVVKPVDDPDVAPSIGFFLDDWQPRTFTAPDNANYGAPATAATTVTVDASAITTKISPSIFGHNAVWWMGPVAGNASFITPINNLQPHIIRFPGGSSSDTYFWNAEQDAKPADAPAQLVDENGVKKDASYIYGKTSYNWQCSLDNYYTMMQQTGNQGIITVNYGYARYGTGADPVAAAAHLAANWVRYDNGRTKYWEVGNENYGNWEAGYRIDRSLNKDGQPEYITGALYAAHFKIFADSMRKAAAEVGANIKIGVVTYESASESWQPNSFKTWNSGMIPALTGKHDFYVAHNYFTPYNANSGAADILGAAATVPGKMTTFLDQEIARYGGSVKPYAMDEWNMFAVGSKQQVSNVSGLFSVMVLGESLKSKIGMATRWDIMNGWENGNDHGLFSAGDEPDAVKWAPRPSFYYLYYFKKMLGDRLVPSTVQGNIIKAYASTYSSGQAGVALVNTSEMAQTVQVKFTNFNPGNRYYWYALEGSNDNGQFSRKVLVNGSGPAGAAGGPADYATLKARSAAATGGVKVTIPALGAVFLVCDKK